MSAKNKSKGKKGTRRKIAVAEIPKGEAVIVINVGERPVTLSRRVSYQPDLEIGTVMKVVEFLAEHDTAKFEFVANRLNELTPVQVGKSLITLEQKGLVEINIESGTVKRV